VPLKPPNGLLLLPGAALSVKPAADVPWRLARGFEDDLISGIIPF